MSGSWEKPSASALQRVDECPTSAAIAVRVSSTGDAAKRGSELHGFIEAVLEGHKSPEVALDDVSPEWRSTAENLEWGKLLSGYDRKTVRMESAYAIDVSSGGVRFLGRSLGRKYPETAALELVGTNDIEGLLEDGVPAFDDVKTGQATTPCAQNWQMRFHAYVQHVKHGSPEVRGRLAYVQESGDVWHDDHLFEASDFADFIDDLRGLIPRLDKALAEVERGIVKVNEGDWCKYCPAFQSCPAKTALLRQLVPDMADIDAAIAALTTQQAAVIWERFKSLKPMVDKIDKALKAYASSHEVVLSTGKVLREVEMGKTSVNGARALELAKKLGAREEDLASCVTHPTWTQIRECNPKITKKKGQAA